MDGQFLRYWESLLLFPITITQSSSIHHLKEKHLGRKKFFLLIIEMWGEFFLKILHGAPWVWICILEIWFHWITQGLNYESPPDVLCRGSQKLGPHSITFPMPWFWSWIWREAAKHRPAPRGNAGGAGDAFWTTPQSKLLNLHFSPGFGPTLFFYFFINIASLTLLHNSLQHFKDLSPFLTPLGVSWIFLHTYKCFYWCLNTQEDA